MSKIQIAKEHFAKLEAPQKWIPYKAGDVLPVEPKDFYDEPQYLVTFENGAVGVNFRFIDNNSQRNEWGIIGRVVAYMPFPAPYNEKGG